MGALNLTEWQKLPMTLSELCINTSLRCGQSFRWRKNDLGVWSMALYGRILSLHQDPEYLYYRSIPASTLQTPPTPPASHPPSTVDATANEDQETLELLHHYLNLGPNLTALYKTWSASDPNFARRAPQFTGIRILRQDAWEALVGFICSSNNNIIRISQMIHKLCVRYGPYLGDLDEVPYHDFPEPKALAGEGVEAELRGLGFGYRARYLAQTARMVVEKEEGWLQGLRNPEAPLLGRKAVEGEVFTSTGRSGYRDAHAALLELQGVGPKVADCVCLMGLGWGEAVPVDTHVWQIAQRDYRFGKGKNATLTKDMYVAVAEKFRGLWGQEAGWAHSVLFTADLKAFSERLVVKKEEREMVKKEEIEGQEDKVVVKKEDDDEEAAAGAENEPAVEKVRTTTKKGIKRERDDEEAQVLKVEEKFVRRSVRRRKS